MPYSRAPQPKAEKQFEKAIQANPDCTEAMSFLPPRVLAYGGLWPAPEASGIIRVLRIAPVHVFDEWPHTLATIERMVRESSVGARPWRIAHG